MKSEANMSQCFKNAIRKMIFIIRKIRKSKLNVLFTSLNEHAAFQATIIAQARSNET